MMGGKQSLLLQSLWYFYFW